MRKININRVSSIGHEHSYYLFSNLEKATKELEPEEDLIDPKLLLPAFAVSAIVNVLLGGAILSQVRATLSSVVTAASPCLRS